MRPSRGPARNRQGAPVESFVAVRRPTTGGAPKRPLRTPHRMGCRHERQRLEPSLMEFYRGGLGRQDAATSRKDRDFDQAFAPPQRRSKPILHALLRHPASSPWAARRSSRTAGSTSGPPRRTPRRRSAWRRGPRVRGENVEVHRVQLGGGFGRRAEPGLRAQGVAIAKAMEGTP